MSTYQVAVICPHCKVVNALPIRGPNKEFMRGGGTLKSTCFDCKKEIVCGIKDVGYMKVD